MVAPDGSDLEHGLCLGFWIRGWTGVLRHQGWPKALLSGLSGRTVRWARDAGQPHLVDRDDLKGTSELNFPTSATNLLVWGFNATDTDAIKRPPMRPLRCAETGSLLAPACEDPEVTFASHANLFQLTIGTYTTKLSSRQDIDRLFRRAKYADCCFPPNARVGSADGCAEWCRVLLTGLGSPSSAISRSVPCEAYYHMIFKKSHVSGNGPNGARVVRFLNGNFV